MTWSEVDLAAKVRTISAPRSKIDAPIRSHLSERAFAIIDLFRSIMALIFFFSSGKAPPSGWSKAKPRLDRAIAALIDGATISAFCYSRYSSKCCFRNRRALEFRCI